MHPTHSVTDASNRSNGAAPAAQIGPYRVLALLGEGGGGLVYEAEHVHLKRRVALKILRADACGSEEHVARFVREAQVIATLHHPNVVAVHDAGVTGDGRPYYAMDRMDGLSLAEYVRCNGRMQPDEAVRLLLPIAGALRAAHAAGVVHRDVKPSNIFLEWTESGEIRARLCDFGIAKCIEADGASGMTTEGRKLGTPVAMAPEQIRGESVDGRTDLYALGVVLHYCIRGEYPFFDEDPRRVEEAHLYDAPPSLELASDEDAIASLVDWCLEKSPDLRPADAAALERAMHAVIEGAPRTSHWNLVAAREAGDATADDSASAFTHADSAALWTDIAPLRFAAG